MNNCNRNNSLFKRAKSLFKIVFFASALFQYSAQSKKIKLVDQFGKPISDAVISYALDSQDTAIRRPAVMDQINKKFSPHVLVIQKGQHVKFPNSDDIRHHVYSFSKPKTFEIRLFKSGGAKPVRFDMAGIVVLGCNIHDQMLGYIYVADGEKVVMTSLDGLAKIEGIYDKLNIWHPRLSVNHSTRVELSYSETKEDELHVVKLELLPEKKKKEGRTLRARKFKKRDEKVGTKVP